MPVTRKGTLSSMAARAENGVMRGLILAGEVVAQRARGKAPRRTGRLKRNIAVGKPYHKGVRTWAIDVGTKLEYARAQEFGSGSRAERGGEPYPIRARKKRSLAFQWPDAPSEVQARFKATFPLVFFNWVLHPGVAPHPYLRPALRESKAVVVTILVKSVVGAIRGG